jgi:hypothetical protein
VKLIAAFVLSSLAIATATLANAPDQPDSFMELILALDQAQPLDPGGREHLLGHPLHCTKDVSERTDCDSQGIDLTEAKVASVDFRFTPKNGGILILGAVKGECVPIDDFKAKFGQGFEHSSCTDGVTCVYLTFDRPWGSLSASLEKDWSAKCAKSVTFDIGHRLLQLQP